MRSRDFSGGGSAPCAAGKTFACLGLLLVFLLPGPLLARAETFRPKGACAAFIHNEPSGRIYPLSRDHPCDLTGMAIALHDGNFRSLYDKQVYTPADKDQILAILDGVDAKLRAKAEEGCPAAARPCKATVRILLFAHGGMVSEDDAIGEASSIAPGAMADGYMPLFLIWNSDPFGSYGERLCCVLEGQQSSRGLFYFWPLRLAGDLAAGFARAPEYYGEQVLRFNDSVLRTSGTPYYLGMTDRDQLIARVGRELDGHIGYPPFERPSELNAGDEPVAERSLEYRALFPVRLATTAVGSQIGAEAWDDMVRRTRLALQPPLIGFPALPQLGLVVGQDPCDAQTRSLLDAVKQVRTETATGSTHADRRRFDIGAEGGFALFADHLSCEISNNFNIDRQLAVVDIALYFYGHSMGAIVGDQLIASHPELPWKRIVYMAAANTTREFRSTVAPLLACSGGQDRGTCLPDGVTFHSLMLHPLAESHDLEEAGIVPEGSLLEWIDEMFGGAKSMDDRTFGKWRNVEKTLTFLPPQARARMYFRVFPAQAKLIGRKGDEGDYYTAQCAAPPGGSAGLPARCHPIVHGDFTNFAFWRTAFLCDPLDKSAVCPVKDWP